MKYSRKYFRFLCLLLPLLSSPLHAEDSAAIVVTIKPLYSLVAHLTAGIETPVLLMKQTQSPHHYNMRPSERRLLAKAKMIVWLGPQLETYLSKIIEQQKSAVIISAIQAENLTLLNKRTKHSHSQDSHDTENEGTDLDKVDPHIWLSTNNALAISRQLSEQLIIQDPENTPQYKKNLLQLITKIEQTSSDIKNTLHSNNQPFISFHDAFQYFENEYNLNYIDSINYDDETGTSLKHLRQIRASMEKYNIQCLVYQAPKPDIIDTLAEQTKATAVALDPLGQYINDEKNAWFEIMQQMTLNFNRCLAS